MNFIIKIASTALQDFHCVDILGMSKSIFLAFNFQRSCSKSFRFGWPGVRGMVDGTVVSCSHTSRDVGVASWACKLVGGKLVGGKQVDGKRVLGPCFQERKV